MYTVRRNGQQCVMWRALMDVYSADSLSLSLSLSLDSVSGLKSIVELRREEWRRRKAKRAALYH